MDNRCVALGFYQNPRTADSVIKKLGAQGLRRCVSIHRSHYNEIKIKGRTPYGLLIGLGISFLAVILLFFFFHNSLLFLLSLFSLGVLGVALWSMIYHFYGVDSKTIDRFKDKVMRGESLVLVLIEEEQARNTLSILRDVESGHPLSFLLRSPTYKLEDYEEEIGKEPLSIDYLSEYAKHLADSLKKVQVTGKGKPILLKRLHQSAKIVNEVRNNVADAEQIEQITPVSADWLIDNTHVIQGNIEEVQRNLPKKYYHELPKLIEGPSAGLPRIYAIAKELIQKTAHRLNKENMVAFLNNYQSIDPLTIGELWAFPLILKLRLIECIQFLALHIDRRLCEGELASFWGNRLLHATRTEKERLNFFLDELANEQPSPSPHFAEELIDHLFDEETVLPLVKKWLEEKLHSNISSIIQEEQKQKIIDEAALSSAIISLINLSQISWREVFESISPVDAIFNGDPAAVYAEMNFETRDAYRLVVEKLARQSKKKEVEISKLVVQFAEGETEEVKKHVGYYLIDKGRPLIEKTINYRPTFFQWIRRCLHTYPSAFYFGSDLLFLLAIEFALVFYSIKWNASYSETLFLALLALLPASEIAIQLINFLISQIIPPFVLPKMSFEMPIAEKNRTLVIIPMVLTSKKTIDENLTNLEIHYLANPDNALRFGLFADFTDWLQPEQETDRALLDMAAQGIENLGKKYGHDKFFLFNRKRVWSPSEQAWIGWERKRGKLETLNLFLSGQAHLDSENILKLGPPEALKEIRFVITLDADTQMPKGKARELVATITHPLNTPRLNSKKEIERGYTIIQPSVHSSFLQGNLTLFSHIFSDASGVNPYTQASSDVYQDLMHEGTYHGKGIYDLQAFQSILTGRFPDEHLLSHDLLEGAYVRVGFASDLSLFDTFPSLYSAWIKRQFRWMRGDWQLFNWLFPTIVDKSGQKIRNPLSFVDRWKIFDNMRRALLAPSLTLLLIVSWLFSTHPAIWTFLAAAVLFTPLFLSLLSNCINSPNLWYASWREQIREIWRTFTLIALLPSQAFVSLQALATVAYRRLISHRHFLEWPMSSKPDEEKKQLFRLGLFSLFAVVIFVLSIAINPNSIYLACPFCVLWAAAPFIIRFLDGPYQPGLVSKVTPEDQKFLRQIARKTWRYFEEFVGPHSNWLPPDNYQAALGIEVAQRTSPTNIGLWLLSAVSAYDLKFITCDTLIDRLMPTFETLKKLERHEGHLLNWYDIQSLKVLYPRYVSTVDSGNLLASLWTLEQALGQVASFPVISNEMSIGLMSAFELFEREDPHDDLQSLQPLKQLIAEPQPDLPRLIKKVRDGLNFIRSFSLKETGNVEKNYWWKKIEEDLLSWEMAIERYLSWVDLLEGISSEQLNEIDSKAGLWREQILQNSPSLQTLASGSLSKSLDSFLSATASPPHLQDSIKKLKEAMQTAEWLAGEKIGLIRNMMEEIYHHVENTNMSFLYNPERKLFSIGFQVDDFKLDSSYYDLLASEARIASLVAIAKEDVPLVHWWALARPYGYVYGRQVLISWGGTMFEYLMPLLFNKCYPGSLLGEACKEAVACQIIYGELRGIPWGISEAAYSEIDARKTYQYRSFGVPGLGFKRGLEEDLVVSPYSTALALAVNSLASVQNFRTLKEEGHLYSNYGYFESIDFTRQLDIHGRRGVIVYAFMAHHQGMSLIAINNALNDNIMPNRFHSDPRIRGVESLLYEKTPIHPPISRGSRKSHPISRLTPFSSVPIMGKMETANSPTPKVNLLSNADYSIMMTNSGGGYSRWKDFDITRWRSDTTCDDWGSYCYIKDKLSNQIWSTTYHPTLVKGSPYSVSFKSDKVEIRRRDYQIETNVDIVVSPEDNVEIRLMTLANLSNKTRQLELTSYSELALAPHRTDAAHPAFNKLFIQTEALANLSGLIAFRRPRSPEDPSIWAAHIIASDQSSTEPFEFETDRSRFIGRGKSLKDPALLHEKLSNTQGAVLDPIFSLRYSIVLKPGERVQISFITAAADQYETIVALMKKYGHLAASQRAVELAWTHAQLDLRHLRIHQEEAQLFQKLASRILYPHVQLRPSADSLRKNHLGQSHLWPYGISGDLPIMTLNVANIHELDLVKQALTAHAFWRLRGLKVDLVILNEESTGYDQPLHEQIKRIIKSYPHFAEMNSPGGIFLLNCDQIPEEDLILILSASQANLIAARGSLRQQVVSPLHTRIHIPHLIKSKTAKDEPSKPLPFLELPYFNGLGGFTQDGREYVIYLGPHAEIPPLGSMSWPMLALEPL